jgi:hypothetical protein
MGWTAKKFWFFVGQGQEIFPFSKASKLALEPTQLSIQLLLGALYFTYMPLLLFMCFYTKYMLKALSHSRLYVSYVPCVLLTGSSVPLRDKESLVTTFFVWYIDCAVWIAYRMSYQWKCC